MKPYKVICAVCESGFRSPRAKARVCKKCQQYVYKVRYIAINETWRLQFQGKLPLAASLICVDCGADEDDGIQMCYDHRRYSEPEKVDAVCGSCNHKRGTAVDLFQLAKELRAKEFA